MKMQTMPESNKTNPKAEGIFLRDVQQPLSSEALFRGAREMPIEHRGKRYSLRITRSGKLILTK